jgi:hypothetical protein
MASCYNEMEATTSSLLLHIPASNTWAPTLRPWWLPKIKTHKDAKELRKSKCPKPPPKKLQKQNEKRSKPFENEQEKILQIRSWETEESVEKNTGKMAKNDKSKRRRHGTCVSQRTTTAMGFVLVHVAVALRS